MAKLIRVVPRNEPLMNMQQVAELVIFGGVDVIGDADTKNPIEEVTEFRLEVELPDSGDNDDGEKGSPPSPLLIFQKISY